LKKFIFNIFKIILPIGVGVYLLYFFYNAMSNEQKVGFFKSIRHANYFWIFLSVVMSFFSHVLRALRWKYLLEPIGYKSAFWHRYHALMVGYIVNMVFSRAGEASRAGMLYKTDQIPFVKSFGTIVAERAVDLFMLGLVFVFAISLRFNDFIFLKDQLLTSSSADGKQGSSFIFWLIIIGLCLMVGVILMLVFNKKLFQKVKHLLIQLKDGVFSIFKAKNPLPFIVYTFLIWTLYVGFFAISLFAIPEIAYKMPFGGILLAFIGGTIGVIFIQGGIGAYPIIVGLIITYYVFPETQLSEPNPEAYAIANITWAAQTLLMLVLGLISLAYFSKNFNSSKS
jgi:uncharacterized protein (TIRG00374 family)